MLTMNLLSATTFLSPRQAVKKSIRIDSNEPEYIEEQPTTLEDTEKETIKKALLRNHGKRKKTAEELKISERTLYRKIKEYNLE